MFGPETLAAVSGRPGSLTHVHRAVGNSEPHPQTCDGTSKVSWGPVEVQVRQGWASVVDVKNGANVGVSAQSAIPRAASGRRPPHGAV